MASAPAEGQGGRVRPSLPPMTAIGKKGNPQSFTAVFTANRDDRRKKLAGEGGKEDSGAEAGGGSEQKTKSEGQVNGCFSSIVESIKTCYGSKVSAVS